MADSEQVTSTTLFEEELHDEMGDLNKFGSEAIAKDVVKEDEILDLAGGAQDAIERHKATLSEDMPKEFTEPMLQSEPEVEELTKEVIPDSTHSEEEELVHTIPEPEPVREPTPEPPREPTPDPPREPTPELPREPTPEPPREPTPEPPREPTPEPPREPTPEPPRAPTPEPAFITPVEPPKAAPLAVEEVNEPTAAPAPASYEPFLLPAPPQLLMQFNTVVELLYWRDVKTTGVVFGASLFLLLSLTVCSIVSVCSYVGLALLSVTICFRIYKGILQAIQKSDEGHPFKLYLDQDVALSEDAVHKYSDAALARLNKTIASLRCIFLVEDLVDSLKFAVVMWILTYVGALFNGLTLLIMGLVGVFSCPIIYEKYQVQIDHYIGMVNNQIKDIVGKVQAKVPGLKRKAE